MLKDLLATADLGAADLGLLLDMAASFKADPHRHRALLQGDSVVLYFSKPSTRTRISFETAVSRLGGHPIVVDPNNLQMGRGETVEDTARVMSRYARAIIIRTHSDEELRRFADAATVPVINALTDGHHPCQSVADLFTLYEKRGVLDQLRLAYVGDGNNVAHSLIEAAALTGMSIAVATPGGYAPSPEVVGRAQALAGISGARITLTEDPVVAVSGADAVYTDVWLSMGDPDAQREARKAALGPYQVNAALMAHAKPDALFMHCLPCHRGEEVTGEVVDGPRSVIFDQAENRLHTAVATLYALIANRLAGSVSARPRSSRAR